jgi:inorganic pyrophosphatase
MAFSCFGAGTAPVLTQECAELDPNRKGAPTDSAEISRFRANMGAMPKKPPEGCIHVVIEIPRGSRNKYEIDHETGHVFLDRRLFTATTYPADYGFIPDTLGDDGDPLDALVLLEDPTYPGVWVDARPVGVMWMQDEAGGDAKIICVPPKEPRWKGVEDLRDLPEELLEEIKHFFDVYKTLEPGKSSTTMGFEGRKAALREIELSRQRYVPHRRTDDAH